MTSLDLLSGEDVVHIGKRLLGATLTTSFDESLTSGIIVETEVYKAPEDKGSHAFANRRTKRTETLFKESGTVYIYLCYGIHHLFNFVTGPKECPHAVLVRAIEPIVGKDVMLLRRKMKKASVQLCNGPGKLSQALGLHTSQNGYHLSNPKGYIKVDLRSTSYLKKQIISSPRVGIAYAKEWAHKPWRFRIKDNPWTSLPSDVIYP